jgi:putative ABC transport system substrate-binding protein
MKRRAFVVGLAAVAVLPVLARAQQKTPLIGFLSGRSEAETIPVMGQFHKALAEAGFVEGQNLRVEYRWAEGRYERLPMLAAELVERRPAVIVSTGGNVTALAAKAATSTIPVVFAAGGDPVRGGIVTSLNRPGGNVTGVSLFIDELAAKRLELLREVAPKSTRLGVVMNPGNPTGVAEAHDIERRATTLGLTVKLLPARAAADLEQAFSAAARDKIQAVLVTNDPFLIDIRTELVRIAAAGGLPVVYFTREFADAGGLISYGASIGDGYHKVGEYAARILLGAKPADLPVQQPTHVRTGHQSARCQGARPRNFAHAAGAGG